MATSMSGIESHDLRIRSDILSFDAQHKQHQAKITAAEAKIKELTQMIMQEKQSEERSKLKQAIVEACHAVNQALKLDEEQLFAEETEATDGCDARIARVSSGKNMRKTKAAFEECERTVKEAENAYLNSTYKRLKADRGSWGTYLQGIKETILSHLE